MNLRLLRGLAGATTLALLATALLSVPTMGANQRDVFFGSPGAEGGGSNQDGSLDPGELTNTPVTHGGKTATTVRIENEGGQTLNHVKVAGGAAADGKAYNPLFPKPDGTSLPGTTPNQATFAAVIPLTTGVTCAPNSSTTFECLVGTLAGNGGFAEFLVVITPPTNPILPPAEVASYPYWLTASWNEGWSSTGNNADYQFAIGSLDVRANSCAGGTASWFLGNEPVNLGDGGGVCFGANASIASGAALGGNGGFATVAVDDGFGTTCPAGFKCFGSTVSVRIIDGEPVPGGVKWTVTWEGTKSLKGVIHFGDDYPTDPNDFVAIPLNRQNKCTTTKTTNCWESANASPGGTKPVSVTVIFYTDGNGKGGGFL